MNSTDPYVHSFLASPKRLRKDESTVKPKPKPNAFIDKTFLFLQYTQNTIKTLKTIISVSGVLLGIYIIISIGFYMCQNSLIFQRRSLAPEYVFKFDQSFEEYFITTEDHQRLNALLFRSSSPSKGLILYFHGNANNLQRWGNYAIDFTSLGYDVLMTDYRGYGKSSGTPNELDLYKDAAIIKEWADKNIPHNKLIIYGRSLGTAIASNLAVTAHPNLLILETPFDELKGAIYFPLKPMLYIFPLHYKFSNKTFLSKVSCKKIIIHGTNDWVVPLSSALELKPLLSDNDQFIIIEDGGHKNLRDFKKYHETLKRVLE